MINKLPLLAFVFFLCACGKKDKQTGFFTGEIEYEYKYESDSMNVDTLTMMRPSKSSMRYDTSDYQSIFFGRDTSIYYYSGKLNKCLGETAGKFECEDYSKFTDSIVSHKIYDTDEKILGYSCRILEMHKRGSFVKYWVSRDLLIAPATYRDHRSYNWDEYGKYAGGGLILRSEHRFKRFTMKGIATRVQEKDAGFKALEIAEKEMERLCANASTN